MYLPVVISIIPVVKVHQKAIVHHISHCGNTDQGRVHAVHSFELHAHLKAWESLMLGGKRSRFLSESWPQHLPRHFPGLLQIGPCPNPPKTRPSASFPACIAGHCPSGILSGPGPAWRSGKVCENHCITYASAIIAVMNRRV